MGWLAPFLGGACALLAAVVWLFVLADPALRSFVAAATLTALAVAGLRR